MTVGQFLDLASHEFDAHLIFDDDGLAPYYALNKVVRVDYDGWQTDGKPTSSMRFDGDRWALCADYDAQPVDPWEHESYQMETVPMFRIYFVAKDGLYDDERADNSQRVRGGTMTIRPRWPNMTKDGGTKIRGVPDLGGPYVDVQVQSSNVEHTKYLELVRTAMAAFDVSAGYFREPHEMSNVQDLAVYARANRSISSPVYAADGPIARTHAVLEAGQTGYRSHVEDHRKIPGYNVRTYLDSERVRDVFPGHRLGKEIKHYYPKNPEAFEPDHPLYHPKIEVAYQTSITDETLYWHDLDTAIRELETTLYNYLDWSGLPVRADDETFVSDEYFKSSSESRRSVKLIDCPLPEIEDGQEAAVMKLWGRTLDSDRDLIDSLVTDGGTPSRQELADRSGYSYRTVRRFVKRCEEIVHDSHDGLSVGSKHMEQMLVQRVRAAETNFRESVENAVINAADAATNRQRSKWSQVKQTYNVAVQKGELRDSLSVRFVPTDRDEATEAIQSIRNAARTNWRSLRGLSLTITMADGTTRKISNLDAWKPGVKKSNTMQIRPDWFDDADQLARERFDKPFSELHHHQRDLVHRKVTD